MQAAHNHIFYDRLLRVSDYFPYNIPFCCMLWFEYLMFSIDFTFQQKKINMQSAEYDLVLFFLLILDWGGRQDVTVFRVKCSFRTKCKSITFITIVKLMILWYTSRCSGSCLRQKRVSIWKIRNITHEMYKQHWWYE